MASAVINNRRDLDAIFGTQAHADFMAMLAGTLWRLERDDAHQAWVAVADDSSIARFGFTRADFPDAVPPELPVWEPIDNNTKRIHKIDFVEWCEANNKLTALLTLLDSDPILKFKWDAATGLEIDNPMVIGAAHALQLDAQAVFNEIGSVSA